MIATDRWHERLRATVASGGRAVLVTVAAATGSTPREPGASMAVTADGQAGTIGGGHLEFEATRLARAALDGDAVASSWIVRFPLAARLGQCCGGVATLAFCVVDKTALGWLHIVAACMRAGTPHALVSCLDANDVPAARLVVTADDARGTLGTLALDSAAIAAARARLRDGGSAIVRGGDAMLFVHVVRPDTFPVLVFGNGHVGQALVHILGALPADVTWIDTREHGFPPGAGAGIDVVTSDAPEEEIARAPHGAYAVIATHSHPLDFAIVEAALQRDDWRYLGLIGSMSKRAQFERRLLARGAAPEAFARLTCPIGEGPLRSKEPGVIAVAVAAQMLALREAVQAHDRPSSLKRDLRRG